ncbi:MAG TPA: hypothetical protein VLU25_07665 [Acidobacteriota bacterium]|nr:hypothetical protein [Acidobacteriota bacterium]
MKTYRYGAPLAAAWILLCVVGWNLLSPSFRYGEGHAQRPILAFVFLWAAAGAGLWLLARSLPSRVSAEERAGWAWKAALLLGLAGRLVLLPTPLIQEDDPYRFVLDGQTVLAGADPYRLTPSQIAQSFDHPLTPQLRGDPQARQILRRVSRPDLHTVYPPVAQGAFALGAWLSGWDWRGQRWVFLSVDLALLALLLWLLKLLALPPQWSLLWACNPLVLKEVANSAHADVLAAFFLLLAIAALCGRLQLGPCSGAVLAGAALGLAVLCKLYILFLLPAFLLWLLKRSGQGPATNAGAALLGTAFALPTAAGLAWMLSWTPSGIEAYAGDWQINAGAFMVLEKLTEALGMPPLAARAGCLLVASAGAVLIPWTRRGRGLPLLICNLQWVLLLWWLLQPAAYPWYALPLLALLPLAPHAGAARAALLLSSAASVYYLHFLPEYNNLEPLGITMITLAEHGVLWAALLLPGRRRV